MLRINPGMGEEKATRPARRAFGGDVPSVSNGRFEAKLCFLRYGLAHQ